MASPYDKAAPFLQEQPRVYQNLLNPYIGRGSTAGESAANIYNQQSNDPGAYLDKLFSSYNPQKGWDQFKNNELMRSLRATAAHGGYAGTAGDQEMQARLFNELLEADRDKWIERVLGINKTGLEGETHFADQGQTAGTNLAELMGNNLGEQASLAYKSQADKNAQKNALIRQLIGAGGALGGAAVGGPIGGAIGSKLGGYTGNIGGQSLDMGSWNSSQPYDFFGGR
jgi:hypothetical protein